VKKYYNIKELLQDKSFHNWVLGLSDKDVKDWEEWQEHNPEQKELIEEARIMVIGIPFSKRRVPAHEIEQKWDELDSLLDEEVLEKRPAFPYFKAAAVISIILFASALVYYFAFNEQKYLSFQTSYGQNIEFYLPDSTKVYLNANSTLKIPVSWSLKKNREVYLEGEAFFDVKKDLENSTNFLVHTEELSVRVLGTSFNVNTYRDETIVVLEEGLVNVESQKINQNLNIALIPGELLSFSSKNKTFIKKAVNIKLHTSWRSNLLKLNRTNLSEFVNFLENYYGITAQFSSPSIKQRQLTGEIPITNLEEMLKAISISLDLKVDNKNGKIFISPN
jgi:transmembrane sensor